MRLGSVNYEVRGRVALLTLDEPHKYVARFNDGNDGSPVGGQVSDDFFLTD